MTATVSTKQPVTFVNVHRGIQKTIVPLTSMNALTINVKMEQRALMELLITHVCATAVGRDGC